MSGMPLMGPPLTAAPPRPPPNPPPPRPAAAGRGAAVVTAPKPAWLGISRVWTRVPSGLYCAAVIVGFVGLVRLRTALRPVYTTVSNRLKASRRNSATREPPRRNDRTSDR